VRPTFRNHWRCRHGFRRRPIFFAGGTSARSSLGDYGCGFGFELPRIFLRQLAFGERDGRESEWAVLHGALGRRANDGCADHSVDGSSRLFGVRTFAAACPRLIARNACDSSGTARAVQSRFPWAVCFESRPRIFRLGALAEVKRHHPRSNHCDLTSAMPDIGELGVPRSVGTTWLKTGIGRVPMQCP